MLWPPHTTMEYAVWEACVTVGIRPPGCEKTWDECNVTTQSKIVAYRQLSEHHRVKEMVDMAKARGL